MSNHDTSTEVWRDHEGPDTADLGPSQVLALDPTVVLEEVR